jgi:acetyl esterase/lipase
VTPSPYHPDLRRIAPLLPRRIVGPRTLPLLRRVDALQRLRGRAGVEVLDVGPISLRIHRPRSTAASRTRQSAALLWLHGGGYVMGTAAQDDALCRFLADSADLLVVAVDYRLAPEHPFPTPLNDCHDALVWLAKQPDVDRARIAIGGASAGGGLAAGLALLARERGEVLPIFQLLSYPMLDDRTASRADLDHLHARLWCNRSNRFGWSAYLASRPGEVGTSQLAAPARCTDLSGVPPAWIGVCTLDIFHDEDLAYADALQAAGVRCDTYLVKGAFHGFDSVRPNANITRQYRQAQLQALRAAPGLLT